MPTEEALLAIGTKAAPVKATRARRGSGAPPGLMAETPTPGKVAEEASTPPKVWSGWLDNNVRVHHRFMDDRKNAVSIQISLIGGELLETQVTAASRRRHAGLLALATRRLSSTDIRG
ncbi:MAG: hypothetical protein U0575_13855 [Phycisphaerales bacterium]